MSKCSACANDDHDLCGYKLGNEYWCDCECLENL